ncbi:hypothetical protein [aff. Roholtiella sp. LEGE 12411]|uniref:hypothetical protein n=1 Tax=aff. Roholtiella sp. LEGE 12411 TaxID=1828822 RepID=UPI001881BE81|nr:hypothetical protein [aff. Roholtiella sp. LEGE 12411]MBE9035705.1 hypothetical protein [aff. Roholtiella sp. LEGE 12411]
MITEIELLTEQECLEVQAGIHEMKELWLQPQLNMPAYKLGAASYIDAVLSKADYYDKAKHYNLILYSRFRWLYERLSSALAEQLKAFINYQKNLAIPGFHIFLSHKMFEQPIAPIHFDLQYQEVDWETTEVINLSQPISFTLAIALPKNGGGLNVWDIRHEEIIGLSPAAMSQLIHSRQKTFNPYKLGWLALHSGHIAHQMAPGKNLQSDDQRITLQGHGVLCGQTWQLYW